MSSLRVESPADSAEAAHRWLVTATVSIGSIAMILTVTIINVAIPDIMGAFGIGQDEAQWLSSGYLAAMTSAMLLADWCIRRIGRRVTYLLAMAVFVTGSVIGGTANSIDILIFGRVLQGAAAGIIQPLAMLTMYQIFPPDERGKAMGIYGLGVILAPAIGPYVGGLAVDALSWRYVMFIPVPICLFASVLAVFALPPKDPQTDVFHFDWLGFSFLLLFVVCLMVGLTNGPRDGWHSDEIVAYMLASVVGLLGFVIWELSTSEPLLNMRLFASFRFCAAAFVSFVFGVTLFGSLYLVPLFVQLVQGYTPTRSGLLQIPAGLAMAVAFPIVGRLTDLGGARLYIVGGFLMLAIASYLMVGVHVDTPFWIFAWWLVFSRFGLALVFPPLSTVSLHVLPPALISQGSGAINFIRTLGGALGVNYLAISTDQRHVFYRNQLGATQTEGNAATLEYLESLRQLLEKAGLPETIQEPSALYYLGQTVAHQALMLAYRDGFLMLAIAAFVAIVPAWLIRPKA